MPRRLPTALPHQRPGQAAVARDQTCQPGQQRANGKRLAPFLPDIWVKENAAEPNPASN